jgi:hypothetical protein
MLHPRSRVAPGVLTAVCEDSRVLLSLDTGQYHTLEGAAATLWDWLSAGLDDQAIRSEYNQLLQADRGQLPDVDVLLDYLKARGLLADQLAVRSTVRPTARNRNPERRITVTRSFWRLLVVSGSLKILGLKRCLTMVHRISATKQCQECADAATKIKEAVRKTELAGTLVPLRTLCLERSIAALWCLRRLGLHAVLRIGVCPFPLRAHAWVEYDGRPVNEHPENLKLYRTFPAFDLDAV